MDGSRTHRGDDHDDRKRRFWEALDDFFGRYVTSPGPIDLAAFEADREALDRMLDEELDPHAGGADPQAPGQGATPYAGDGRDGEAPR